MYCTMCMCNTVTMRMIRLDTGSPFILMLPNDIRIYNYLKPEGILSFYLAHVSQNSDQKTLAPKTGNFLFISGLINICLFFVKKTKKTGLI